MRIITLISFFVISFFTLKASEKDKSDILSKGDKVPDFKFEVTSGQEKSFSEYKNKTVLIVFFATWCQPCREELPYVQKDIWNVYKDNENFSLIVIGRGHDEDEIDAFRKQTNYSFPMAPDKSKSIYEKFALQYIPRSYLIDNNGKVIHSTKGYERKMFKRLVKQIGRELSKVQ